jgi:UDP-3-O-[3-hydroxymyristoyl] glucosamine N-acyltransferase
MKKLTAVEFANMLKAEVIGDKNSEITGVASLNGAKKNDISFLGNNKYIDLMSSSKAAVILVPEDFQGEPTEGKAWIKCDNPTSAFSKAIDFFAPPPIEYKPGVHPSAIIAESAEIASNCHIGACAVIEEKAVVGEKSVICANVYIGQEVKIGSGCKIYPGTVIRERCIIGNNVIIHSNVCIGGDGFGYTPSPFGIVKIPQVGIVQIDDEVEIGANTTIDRARFGKTWIKFGVKIDDQVHVAHNVTVGEFSMLIGQCGIAGSTTLGQGVIVAAQAGINMHITLHDGCKVGPCAVVKDDVPAGGVVIGYPAESPRNFMAKHTLPSNVKKLKNRIKDLESVVESLKSELAELNKAIL